MATEKVTKTLYTLLLLLIIPLYFVINRYSIPKFDLRTSVDDLIPFSPVFSAFYLSYIAFLISGIAYAFRRFDAVRYSLFCCSLITIQLLSYILHVIVPTKIIRPAIGSGIFEDLTRLVYMIDNPNNLTPSLHVANSWLIALFVLRPSIMRPIFFTWSILIIMSTVLIQQHNLIDVISGMLLSSTVYAGCKKIEKVNNGYKRLLGSKN